MAQDSKASDPPATPKDREALAAIARKIAQSKKPGRAASEPGNGAETAAADGEVAEAVSSLEPAVTGEHAITPETAAGLLEVLPGGVAVCADERLVQCNDAFALAFGYRAATELVSAGGLAVIFPDLGEHPLAELGDLTQDTEPRVITLHGCSRSGRRFRIPVATQPLHQGLDAPLFLVLHPGSENESEPVEASEAGAPEPETQFQLADGISDGLIQLDDVGTITALSPKAAALLGVKRTDALGRRLETFVDDADRRALHGAVADLSGPAAEAELRIRLASEGCDGDWICLSLARTAGPGSGTVWAMLKKVDAVPETDIPSPEIDAPKAPRILPRSNAANLEFLAKVSHEVRTPLNSIIGFAELMREERFGPIGNVRYRGYVNDIFDSGIYALSLINDLLDISKLEAGKFELNFTAVDANEVIVESVQAMQPQARQGRVVLRMSLAESLPHILADRRGLKQILLNLISNAIKFTEARGQVVVTSRVDADGHTHISVRDSGIGMSESDITQAMKPFGQLDTAPRKQVGTGLGLPLTKALAEANRAEFELESRPGRGTRIDIIFPVGRQAGGESAAAAPE
ncbi:MAG: ATP-binding protein [Methyloligellaceae bacterium]